MCLVLEPWKLHLDPCIPGYAYEHRCACRVIFCQNLSITDQTRSTHAAAAAAAAAGTGNDDDYAAYR